MVSDQCQALVKDNVIVACPTDKTTAMKRKVKPDEMISSVIVENKEVDMFDNLFFLITVMC